MQGGYCVCAGGHAGADCSQHVVAGSSSAVAGPDTQCLARVGHTLVHCAALVCVFGGYSVQRGLLRDLWTYNVTSRHWQLLDPADPQHPAPRSASHETASSLGLR